jgi:hypothetical protein
MKKAVAVLGLVAVSNAFINNVDDELWGVDVKTKVQTVPASHNSGSMTINMKDDADNELHRYYSMPGNEGNIQFNDYTKTHDDELFNLGVDVKTKVQTLDAGHNRGKMNINIKDDADNELHNYYSMPKNQGSIQFNDYTVKKDDADNELHNYISMPKNKGSIQFNDYSQGRDDEFFNIGVDVKTKVQTVPASHNSGKMSITMKDDADNELHNYYSMPKNQGNIQFNDYTKTHDDELFNLGVDVKTKVQTLDAGHNRGKMNINIKDDADNELHNYYSMPKNQGNIQFNDYTVKKDDNDDEFWGVDVKTKVQTVPASHNSGSMTINMKDDEDYELFNLGVDVKTKVQTLDAGHNRGKMNINIKDDADNELHNYYSMPKNQGNIQFNDYTKTHDDEYWGVSVNTKVQTVPASHNSGTMTINMGDDAEDEFWGVDVKTKVQTVPASHNSGKMTINMKDDADDEFWGVDVKTKVQTVPASHNSGSMTINMKDDADNELHNYYSMPKNQGNIQFNDYTKTHDDADDEFYQATPAGKGIHRDEIEILSHLLKLASQDKNGNLVLDGVKIGKIPQYKGKTNTTTKPHAELPKRNFLAF